MVWRQVQPLGEGRIHSATGWVDCWENLEEEMGIWGPAFGSGRCGMGEGGLPRSSTKVCYIVRWISPAELTSYYGLVRAASTAAAAPSVLLISGRMITGAATTLVVGIVH